MTSLEKFSENLENDSVTVDRIYSRDIKICQHRNGYRFNSDSVILSWFIYRILGGKKINRSLEIGSGTGVVPIILKKRGFASAIECIEIQPGLFNLLQKNISDNKLEDSLFPKNRDIREITKEKDVKYDLVFTNPPYFGVDNGKINPDNEKAISKHEFSGSLSDFMSVSKKILNPGGHFIFIYPLSKIFFAMGSAMKNDFVLNHIFLFRENPDLSPVSFCAHLVFKGQTPVTVTDMITMRDDKGNYSKTGLEIMHENQKR